jgi:hypothetical protein
VSRYLHFDWLQNKTKIDRAIDWLKNKIKDGLLGLRGWRSAALISDN